MNISAADLERGELEMKKFGAIIKSMTRKERLVPAILDASRKGRIAKGAGVDVADITILLQRFAQSAQALKQFKRMGLFK